MVHCFHKAQHKTYEELYVKLDRMEGVNKLEHMWYSNCVIEFYGSTFWEGRFEVTVIIIPSRAVMKTYKPRQ